MKKYFFKYGLRIAIPLIIILLLQLVSVRIINAVPDQKANLSWGGKKYAQVSCLSSKEDSFTTDELRKYEYAMNQTGKWTDAYSGKGKLTVTNGNAQVDGVVYGVGNDFFTFHPLELLSGGYIDSDNVMKDYIMLDEESAWQLFGSDDVAGMSVEINGERYIVSGVYKREGSGFHKAAGNGEITFYICWEALEKMDDTAAITFYEFIMENPVRQYAYDFAVKNLVQDDNDAQDNKKKTETKERTVIENSDRYSVSNTWNRLKNFGKNAMDLDEIAYPYWENVARAYSSILCLSLVAQIVSGAVIVIVVFSAGIRLYRKRKDGFEWIKAKGRAVVQKITKKIRKKD